MEKETSVKHGRWLYFLFTYGGTPISMNVCLEDGCTGIDSWYDKHDDEWIIEYEFYSGSPRLRYAINITFDSLDEEVKLSAQVNVYDMDDNLLATFEPTDWAMTDYDRPQYSTNKTQFYETL